MKLTEEGFIMLGDIKLHLIETWPLQFGESMEGAIAIGLILLILFIMAKPLSFFLPARFSILANALLAVFLFMTNLYSINSTPFLEGNIIVFVAYVAGLLFFAPIAILIEAKNVATPLEKSPKNIQ
jgi:hypothetical protein